MPPTDDLDELAELSQKSGGLGELTDDEDDAEIPEAYCVKCRETVEIEDPQPVWTSKGTPGTRGTCPDCGSTVFRMGKTPAHDALIRPPAVRVDSATKISTSGRKRAQPATYINFVRADTEIAQKLAADLRNVGVHTWIDSGASVTEDEIKWAGGVHPALRDSSQMIVVLSRAAHEDTHFNEAWKFFKDHKKPIFLAVLDDAEVPDTLRRSPRFSFNHHEDVKQYKTAFRQLLSALGE